jgi:hypothetical protein
MSTLATNKIGTLAGTADMSLPTTRPSQTLSAFLDSAGNLTFEETSIAAEFFVVDGTTFVSSILVDTSYLTTAGWTEDPLMKNTSGQVFGTQLGMWNLSDAIKTNYLSTTNIRMFDLIGNGVSDGDNSSTTIYMQLLDSTGGLVYGENQLVGRKYQSLDGSTSTSQGGSMTSTTWYASSTANYGGNVSYQSIGEGDNEPMPWNLRMRVKPAVNYGWRVDFWGTMSYTTSYGPAASYTTFAPRVDQTIDISNSDAGGPWKQIGGFYIGTNQESGGSYASTAKLGSFVLKAQIKPTAVVAS